MLLPLAFSSNSSTSQAPRNSVPVAARSTRNRLWCLSTASTPQPPLAGKQRRLLDPDQVPALERGHHHGRRLDPSPPEVAAAVGSDHQADQVLRQQDHPEREEDGHPDRS